MRRHGRYAAFSLIELLVAIAIIALLMAISIPVLARAKEKSRRTVCRSNIRSLITAVCVYADDSTSRLPSGLSDMGRDEHTPVLSTSIYESLLRYAGDEEIFVCPWVGGPFADANAWQYENYGYVIGYNYLGGHEDTPWPKAGPATEEWTSPQTTTEKPYLPLIVELNAWTEGGQMTWAPHGARGPITAYADWGKGGMTSQEAGAAGGNIGLLDGSVSWKKVEDMEIYLGSRMQGTQGCMALW